MTARIYPKVQNYHCHKDDTNAIIIDSPATYQDYAKRVKELGHSVLSSVAHGWQGAYRKCYDIAAKNGLKFVFGTEAYFVTDRLQKDGTNAHMIILARNEKGRQDINDILSTANEDGFYRQARLDMELLKKLSKEDVVVTTACVGGVFKYGYGKAYELIKELHQHFGDSFYLEVQYHLTNKQREVNTFLQKVSEELGIQLIVGMDSHYISAENHQDRVDLLASKKINYPDEEGWFLDYPTDEECFNRFMEQGILSEEEILQAMKNTNVTLTFDDITFDRSPKLPSIYPHLTQAEKNALYKQRVLEGWNEFRKDIPRELWPKYEEEIKYEVKAVCNTNVADYFLLDYELVKRARERGGLVTYTGRGSAPSYFTNTLLGLSKIDRVSAPIILYPDRFISENRLLAGSMPDIDINVGTPQILADIQEELLGVGHSYPMIAFGTIKAKSGFKLYARSCNLDVSIANEVSKQIEKYQKAYSKASEEQKEDMSIYDYVDSEYHSYLDEAEKYLGMICDKKLHPCAYLIYQGDIRREIGLMRITTGKKEVKMVACITGEEASAYGFIKNDVLKVETVLLTDAICKRIGIKQPTVNELIRLIDNDEKTWSIYEKGLTMCVNQVESEGTTTKAMTYKPKNLAELSAFIAAIRPGFKSLYKKFESREPFDFGIKVLDDLLQNPSFRFSYLLFQEQIMAVLQLAGFHPQETYTIIKAISKKANDKIVKIKEEFVSGLVKKIVETEDGITEEEAMKKTLQVWQVIYDASNYSFNSSHSLCVSLDSLYGAYLKAHYPHEFYATVLQLYSDKGDKDKVALIVQEMERGFGIKLGQIKFRRDNRKFSINKEEGIIEADLSCLKNMNKQTALELYNIKDNQYSSFTDLLIDLTENTSIDKTKLEILIKLNYFEEFGKNKKLLELYAIFRDRYKKTYVDKTKNSRKLELLEIERNLDNAAFSVREQLKIEVELLGYAQSIYPNMQDNLYCVFEYDNKYGVKAKAHNIARGETLKISVQKNVYDVEPFGNGSIIKLQAYTRNKNNDYYNVKQYRVV